MYSWKSCSSTTFRSFQHDHAALRDLQQTALFEMDLFRHTVRSEFAEV